MAEVLTQAGNIEEAKVIAGKVIGFYKKNGEEGERLGLFLTSWVG